MNYDKKWLDKLAERVLNPDGQYFSESDGKYVPKSEKLFTDLKETSPGVYEVVN